MQRNAAVGEFLRRHQAWLKSFPGISQRIFGLPQSFQGREFFREIATILKPGGQLLVVEPPLHVSLKAFAEMVKRARIAGFTPADWPKVFLSKAVVLHKD